MKKKIFYFLQSIIVYLLYFISKIIGLKLSRVIFSFIFTKVGNNFKSKKIIINNLNRICPEISNLEKEIIVNKMWSNYGKTFVEYIFLKNFKKKTNHIDIKNKRAIDEILKKNKPVVFISGHFANYELMSMELTKAKAKLATIYRPLNNIFLNHFMEYLRRKYICKNQIKKGINGVRDCINFLKKKHSIALMIDQRVSEGERIDLFNKPALTTTLPAQLSIKFGLEIIPVYIERDENNNFKIEFQERINPKNFSNKIDLTKKLNEILEKMIMKNPYQWIWTHNRWK